MFCKYCGATLDDDSVFCTKCGKKLKSDDSTPIVNINNNDASATILNKASDESQNVNDCDKLILSVKCTQQYSSGSKYLSENCFIFEIRCNDTIVLSGNVSDYNDTILMHHDTSNDYNFAIYTFTCFKSPYDNCNQYTIKIPLDNGSIIDNSDITETIDKEYRDRHQSEIDEILSKKNDGSVPVNIEIDKQRIVYQRISIIAMILYPLSFLYFFFDFVKTKSGKSYSLISALERLDGEESASIAIAFSTILICAGLIFLLTSYTYDKVITIIFPIIFIIINMYQFYNTGSELMFVFPYNGLGWDVSLLSCRVCLVLLLILLLMNIIKKLKQSNSIAK